MFSVQPLQDRTKEGGIRRRKKRTASAKSRNRLEEEEAEKEVQKPETSGKELEKETNKGRQSICKRTRRESEERGRRGGTCALRQRSSQCCFSSCVCSTVSLRLDSWVMSDW